MVSDEVALPESRIRFAEKVHEVIASFMVHGVAQTFHTIGWMDFSLPWSRTSLMVAFASVPIGMASTRRALLKNLLFKI
jgi:hypothetical protein